MSKLEHLYSKAIAREDLQKWMSFWRFKGKRIVFTNGCFDIMHKGHVDYLAKAADHGDILIVGVNTDASVERIKGNGRPIQDQDSRVLVLSALHFVDAVVLFEEDTPEQLIAEIVPDVLAKGSDYQKDNIVGADSVRRNGGEVVTIDFVEGYSTTRVIEKILSLHS